MSVELEQAQRLINAIAEQRNAALNSGAQCQAALEHSKERILDLEAQVIAMEDSQPKNGQ